MDARLHYHLLSSGTSVSVAESCTSGLLASSLTDLTGASNYFAGGLVVYNDLQKIDRLGIPATILEMYGAVSAECADYMAKNVSVIFRTRWGVSTTGIIRNGNAFVCVYDSHTDTFHRMNMSTGPGSRSNEKMAIIQLVHSFWLKILAKN